MGDIALLKGIEEDAEAEERRPGQVLIATLSINIRQALLSRL